MRTGRPSVSQSLTYPLSPGQRDALCSWAGPATAGAGVAQIVMTFDERLDIPTFRLAWQGVIERHEVLRASVLSDGRGAPVQRMNAEALLPVRESAGRCPGPDEYDARLADYFARDRAEGFDLARAPLMRVAILPGGGNGQVCVWSFHRLILDERSASLVLREVFTFYDAFQRNEHPVLAPPVPYTAYLDWLSRQSAPATHAYWRDRLAGIGAPAPLAGIVSGRRTDPVDTRPARCDLRLPEECLSSLCRIAAERGFEPQTALSAAWALLLSRYSRDKQVVIGRTNTRNWPPLMREGAAAGQFDATIPLRIHVDSGARVWSWLEEVRRREAADREHELLSLEEYRNLRDSSPDQPLFNSRVVVDAFYPGTPEIVDVSGRRFRLENAPDGPLTIQICRYPQLCVRMLCDAGTLTKAELAPIAAQLGTLLRQMAARGDRKVCQLSLMTGEERRRVLVAWNDTARDYPRTQRVHHLVERQVEACGERVAVVAGERSLTYGELNRRANCLARRLLALGIGPGMSVGVCLPQAPEMVVAVLGILKAGGTYAPLDPDYPRSRLATMLEDLAVPVVVTEQRLMACLPLHAAATLCLDNPALLAEQDTDVNPRAAVTPEDLVYVIFTSGSTGRPKGTAVRHRGFSNLLHWYVDEFHLGPDDRFLLVSSFGFDLTQKNIFAPLICGGQLHLPGTSPYDPDRLLRAIADQRITVLNCTPSAFYPLVEAAEKTGFAGLASLRHLFLGGETILLPRLRKWMASPSFQAEIVNTYGPTECTDICASHRIGRLPERPESVVPIGKPITNARIYIVDPDMNPLPPGVTGELCIGGAGVGAGYVGNPELTAEKFIADPFEDALEECVYRTGDLARYLPDGTIELVGREDHQVKVRGFRIELGEIEAVLSDQPHVRQAVVATRPDGSGNSRLIAYVVPDGLETPTAQELAESLGQQLPRYMVPAAFVFLPALPLTPNGKVDRNSLPEPGDLPAERQYIAPETPVEQMLAEIWTQILVLECVGADDNFFERGGHSLSATMLKSRIEAVFGVDIPLFDIFQSPTLSHLSGLIEQHLIDQMDPEEIIQTLQE